MELDHEGLGVLGAKGQSLCALLGTAEIPKQFVVLPAAQPQAVSYPAPLHLI